MSTLMGFKELRPGNELAVITTEGRRRERHVRIVRVLAVDIFGQIIATDEGTTFDLQGRPRVREVGERREQLQPATDALRREAWRCSALAALRPALERLNELEDAQLQALLSALGLTVLTAAAVPDLGRQWLNERSIAISGSRSPSPATIAQLQAVIAVIPHAARILVGRRTDEHDDIDRRARELLARRGNVCLDEEVAESNQPRHLVARSLRLAQRIGDAAGVLVSLPDKPWPAELLPGQGWPKQAVGGTFGTLRAAVGNGARALVWVPDASRPAEAWNAEEQGSGWWAIRPS